MSDGERRGPSRKRRRRFRDRRPHQGQEQSAPSAPAGRGAQAQRRAPEREETARRGRDAKGRRGTRERETRPQYKSVILLPEEEAAPCPICGKRVRDAVAALSYGEERTPAHFDCVLESLRGGKELRGDEQLCYLGGGDFGVVRFNRAEGSTAFTIRDRIQYESAHERPAWRRNLDSATRR